MDISYRPAPTGFTEEEWQYLRHDLKKCAKSMHTMQLLLSKKAITLDDVLKELEKMGKQLDKTAKAIFEEQNK